MGDTAHIDSSHQPIRRVRTGSAYTTDDGEEIPRHALVAYDCACGYRAGVFMASARRAMAIFERHLDRETRLEVEGASTRAVDVAFDRLDERIEDYETRDD